MSVTEFTQTDTEDIEAVLPIIESSFDFKFNQNELVEIRTYGELKDTIIGKISKSNKDDCTTQQAFYKLREALSKTLEIAPREIKVNSNLEEIIPRNHRRQILKDVERFLGFEINILRPNNWIIAVLAILFLVSIITLNYDWKMGLIELAFSIIGLKLAFRFGRSFKVNTVNAIVSKMTRDNYLNSRRNNETINLLEIENIIDGIFCEHLMIAKSELQNDALIEDN